MSKNKTLSDYPDKADDIDDAVNKAHVQNTDTVLDEGGANEVSAEAIGIAITASSNHIADTDNPHGTTAEQVGLGDADNAHHVAIAGTGVEIDFTRPKIFNSPASAGTGNITNDLTGAVIGVVQKIYHEDSTAPTVPAGWILLAGEYVADSLNIIYAEWVSGTRVEYWIVQEVV